MKGLIFEDITHSIGKPKESITWFEYDDSWKLEEDEYINSIKEGKSIFNGQSSDEMKVLSLVESIYKNSGFYSDNK